MFQEKAHFIIKLFAAHNNFFYDRLTQQPIDNAL